MALSNIDALWVVDWSTDRDGQCSYIDPLWREITGQNADSALQEGWLETVYPGDRDQVRAELTRAIQSEQPFQIVLRLRRADGHFRWAMAVGAAKRDEQAAFIGYNGSIIDFHNRVEAEQELAETRQRLEAIMNAAPIGLSYSSDPSCAYITGNKALFAQFEINARDNISALAPDPADAGRRVRFFNQGRELTGSELPLQAAVRERREVEPFEIDVQLPSGRRWTAEASGAPIIGPDGRLLGGVAVTVDITERKKHIEALQGSEKRYRLLFETSRDGIVTVDLSGHILEANPAYQRMLGYTGAELRQLTYQELTPAIWRDMEAAIVQEQVLPRGESDEYEKEYIRKDGTVFPVSLRTWTVTDDAGVVVGMRAFVRDITERKRAEEKLRESERLLQAVLDGSPDAIFLKDGESRLLLANPATFAAIGKPADFCLGKTDEEVFDNPEDGRAIMANDRRIMESGQTETFEETLGTAFGTRCYLTNKAPYRDAAGNIVGIIGTARDITEQKRAEAALREREQRMRRFYEAGLLGVIYWNVAGEVTDANDKFLEMVGYSRADLQEGRINWRKMTPPEFQFVDDAAILEAQAAGSNASPFEKQFFHKNGARVPVIVAGAMFDETRTNGVAFVLDISETKRAEAELRESEERFRVSFANAAIGFAVNAPDFGFLDANPAYCELTGYTLEDLLAQDGSQLIHPDDRSANLALTERMLAGEIPSFVVENRYIRKCGEVIWVRKSVSLIRNISGAPRWIITLVEDVTERKKAEQALRASEARLRLATEAAKIGAFDWDIPAGVNTWTPELEAMYGLAPGEFAGSQAAWEQLVHPDDRAGAIAKVEETLATGEPVEHEWRVVWRDGSVRWIAGRFQGFTDSAKRPVRLTGVNIDITERKRAELALRESQQQLALALEAGQLGFWDWDVPSGRVQFGGRWASMLGYDLDEVESHVRAWEVLVHPDDRDSVAAKLIDHLEGRADFYECEHRLLHKDGSWRWILDRGQVVERDADRRPLRAIGTHADVTARHEAEVALQEADRRKDEFLATLAHELRNPLTPIRNAVHLLKIKHGSEHPEAHLFNMMQRQVDHLVRLVDDLLEISRISRGKIELRKENVALAEFLSAALETCQPLIDKKTHCVVMKTPDEPAWVFGDPVRLSQIAANVIHNAAKYTPPGGRLEVEAARAGNDVVLRFRDNGVGISAEMLPHVFELFAQTDGQARLSEGGLGIGLALVRKLLELHGGRIEAHSEGVGRGSEFVVWLPLGTAPTAVTASTNEAATRDRMAARILVIDDDADVADSFGLLLEGLGATVRKAYSGPAGIALVETFDPDLIFIDVGMPAVDGYETARRIRRSSRGPQFTLVALTGWGQDEDRHRAKEAGFDLHLTKPASIDAVQDLLNALPSSTGGDGSAKS
ncbi:PAS domain S-box protein [Methylocystis echinoides]|uniref:PAS domain S-box protein n=1 Tax=Methylocystis echinoides TaxID=29468 RepID=UPI00343C9018